MNAIKLAWIVAASSACVALAIACGSDDDADADKQGGDGGSESAAPPGPGSDDGGNKGDGADAGPPPIPYAAYCDKLADETAALAKRCNRVPANEQADYRSVVRDDCVFRKQFVDEGREVYDGAAATACIAAIGASTCNMAGERLCDANVFVEAKNLAAGKGCESTRSCAAGLACVGAYRCSVCTPMVAAAIGASCDESHVCDAAVGHCALGKCAAWRALGETCSTAGSAGLTPGPCNPKAGFCDPDAPVSSTGICVAPKGLDEACGGCYPYKPEQTCCTATLACDSNGGSTPATCKAVKKLGETCQPGFNTCAEGSCAATTLSGGTSTCKRIFAEGQACTTNQECASNVCDPASKVCKGSPAGAACQPFSDLCDAATFCKATGADGAPTNTGTCTPRGGVGAACGAATLSHPNSCQNGLICRTGACVARVPGGAKVGETCIATNDCEVSAYCPGIMGSCVARSAVDQPCGPQDSTFSLQCVDGVLCSSAGGGKCTTKVAELAEPCLDKSCRTHLLCVAHDGGSTCTPRAGLGSSCAGGEICTAIGTCSGGACKARSANGAACTAANQCLSSICADAGAAKTCSDGC